MFVAHMATKCTKKCKLQRFKGAQSCKDATDCNNTVQWQGCKARCKASRVQGELGASAACTFAKCCVGDEIQLLVAQQTPRHQEKRIIASLKSAEDANAGRTGHAQASIEFKKAGGHCRLPLLDTEETQWSPNQIARPETIRANLFRSPVQCLEAVGTFPHADLPCLAQALASFSKSRLCRVRRRFPGSEALRCKGSGINANCCQLCLPFRAVFAVGTEFMLWGMWGESQAPRRSRPSLGHTVLLGWIWLTL